MVGEGVNIVTFVVAGVVVIMVVCIDSIVVALGVAVAIIIAGGCIVVVKSAVFVVFNGSRIKVVTSALNGCIVVVAISEVFPVFIIVEVNFPIVADTRVVVIVVAEKNKN